MAAIRLAGMIRTWTRNFVNFMIRRLRTVLSLYVGPLWHHRRAIADWAITGRTRWVIFVCLLLLVLMAILTILLDLVWNRLVGLSTGSMTIQICTNRQTIECERKNFRCIQKRTQTEYIFSENYTMTPFFRCNPRPENLAKVWYILKNGVTYRLYPGSRSIRKRSICSVEFELYFK